MNLKSKTSTSVKKMTVTASQAGLLHFSQKTDYALFLMAELAKGKVDSVRSLRLIADKNFLSFSFLQKVAFELRRAGLLHADRGKNGGYHLSRPAEEISLLKILEAVEGPLTVMHCLSDVHCVRAGACHVRPGLQMVYSLIAKSFSHISLADLLSQSWTAQL
jgi:Rrf2 family protein